MKLEELIAPTIHHGGASGGAGSSHYSTTAGGGPGRPQTRRRIHDPQAAHHALTAYRRFVESDPQATQENYEQQEQLLDTQHIKHVANRIITQVSKQEQLHALEHAREVTKKLQRAYQEHGSPYRFMTAHENNRVLIGTKDGHVYDFTDNQLDEQLTKQLQAHTQVRHARRYDARTLVLVDDGKQQAITQLPGGVDQELTDKLGDQWYVRLHSTQDDLFAITNRRDAHSLLTGEQRKAHTWMPFDTEEFDIYQHHFHLDENGNMRPDQQGFSTQYARTDQPQVRIR